MREGENPAKINCELLAYFRHRVIVPVYVPSLEGYFRDYMDILHLCIGSLCASVGRNANVTIIANGCCPAALRALEGLNAKWGFDQLVVNRINRGKVDAVCAGLRGSYEELLTIADSDVLFLPGWLEEIEKLFRHFPECGVASVVPIPHKTFYFTSSTMCDGFTRRLLAFRKVVPDQDLDRFAISIGLPPNAYVKPRERNSQLIVSRGGFEACVGCGHFLMTLHRDVVAAIPTNPSLIAYGPKAETTWLDEPSDRCGYWRLSTPKGYAYHMGNVSEPWMQDLMGEPVRPPAATRLDALPRRRPSRIPRAGRRLLMKVLGPWLAHQWTSIGQSATDLDGTSEVRAVGS